MRYAQLTKKQEAKIKQICFENKWSNRTYAKLVRMARSIADLAGVSVMSDQAIEEAIKWKTITTRFQSETENVGISNG